MYNIVYGNVVIISNGCYRLSTFKSKTVQYNIIMINHFPPEQDLTHINQYWSRQTFTIELQQLHALVPVAIKIFLKALFQATSIDLASVLFNRLISQLYNREERQYVLTRCIASILSLPVPKTLRYWSNYWTHGHILYRLTFWTDRTMSMRWSILRRLAAARGS